MKKVELISNYQQQLIFKLEDVEALVSNIEKRLTVIDEFSNKIVEFEGNVNVMESRIKKDREELRSDLLTFTQHQEYFKETLEVFQKQKDAIKDDIAQTNNTVTFNKYELESKLSHASQNFKDAVFVFNSKLDNTEVEIEQCSKKISSLSECLPQIESIGNEALRNSGENKAKISKLNQKVEKNSVFLSKEIDKVRNIAMTNKSDILANKKEIKRIDDKILADESAICNEIKLTDPLYTVFSDLPTLKILADYDLKRMDKVFIGNYSEFVKDLVWKLKDKAKELVDRPLPIVRKESNLTTSSKKKRRKEKLKSFKKKMAMSIKQSMSRPVQGVKVEQSNNLGMAQAIKTTVTNLENQDIVPAPKFNKKSSITSLIESKILDLNQKTSDLKQPDLQKSVLKKPDLLKLDFKTFDLNIEQKHGSIPETPKDRKLSVVIQDAMNKSISMVSITSNSDSSSELFIDFTPMIESVRIDLQNEVQLMYSDLKSQIEQSSNSFTLLLKTVKSDLQQTILSIKTEHEEYTANMDKKLSEIEICIQQAVYECNSATNQRKRDHVDYANQFKFVKNGFDEITSQNNSLLEKFESLGKVVDGLIDFGKISVALQGQDENDRESIFLMGSKVSKKNKVVSIDKRCLSCAGQSSAVISAFKIACLAYEPSLVQYQERKFTRKSLLKVQKKMLECFGQGNVLNLSDEFRDFDRVVVTSGQWRPLSVPVSRFTTLASPHLRTPDVENLPILRKSINF